MKMLRLAIFVTLVVGLFAGFSVSAVGQTGAVGIYSIATCKDTTTVAIMGWSEWATNRIRTAVYSRNAEGQEKKLDEVHTGTFGPGRISLAIELNYVTNTVAAGRTVRVEVQLERQGGDSFVDVGGQVHGYAIVPDMDCVNKCTVTFNPIDAPRADGTVTLRSHYGSWFRPEGWLHSAVPVASGRKTMIVFVGLPCNWTVRVWYYPKTGDPTPLMLPAQYWPNEFEVTTADGTNPYTTSFASGLAPTAPLEDDDPFVRR